MTAAQEQPTYAGALSFFRCRYQSDAHDADVAVIGVPFDGATTGRSGCRLGPRAIREASSMLAWSWHYRLGRDLFERMRVIDTGDISLPAGESTASILSRIHAHISALPPIPILALGGDHSMTYAFLKALSAREGRLALVQFDAHSDTWAPDPPDSIDHGSVFYHAVRDGFIDPEHSIQIGLRTHNEQTHGFHQLFAHELIDRSPSSVAETVASRVQSHPVYITVDIDVLDPAFAPGTGTPVPGGLDTGRLMAMIYALSCLRVVGMDVVEVNPAYDHAGVTALAAAQLSRELLTILSESSFDAQTR